MWIVVQIWEGGVIDGAWWGHLFLKKTRPRLEFFQEIFSLLLPAVDMENGSAVLLSQQNSLFWSPLCLFLRQVSCTKVSLVGTLVVDDNIDGRGLMFSLAKMKINKNIPERFSFDKFVVGPYWKRSSSPSPSPTPSPPTRNKMHQWYLT